MESFRSILLIALAFVLFLLYQAWVEDYAPKPLPRQATDETGIETDDLPAGAPVTTDADMPSLAPVTRDTSDARQTDNTIKTGERITVVTDVLNVELDTTGADIRKVDLLDYPKKKDQPDDPVRLLNDSAGEIYVLQSGLRTGADQTAPDHTIRYETASNTYQLGSEQEELKVLFRWSNNGGITVDKIYTFKRNSYLIELEYVIDNKSADPWTGDAYYQLKRQQPPIERSMFDPNTFSYTGPAMYDGERYDKLGPGDLVGDSLLLSVTGGWAAMLQHYFLAALVPPQDAELRYYASATSESDYRIGYVAPSIQVAPGASGGFYSQLFIGPKLQEQLEALAPGLELAVDYGALTLIAKPLFWLLNLIYQLTGNWGWAIILLTVLIKLVFYKPQEVAGKSMAKMRKLQPRMVALRERYGDDRQKLNVAMMELYKKEKINPASGCLPILIQIPVFIALYWVLLESVELRQAPFTLWLTDLSSKDPYYVLPLLMGAAMWVQQKLNPAPPDPIQARVMMMMPIMMVVFAAIMPAGLVLYWVVNTVLSVAQQWKINRVIEGHTPISKKD